MSPIFTYSQTTHRDSLMPVYVISKHRHTERRPRCHHGDLGNPQDRRVYTGSVRRDRDLAPVPLTIFRSNSKFDQNLQGSDLKCPLPITTKFCTRHDSYTVMRYTKFRCDRWRIVWTGALQIWLNFAFDRNIVSGTGAWSYRHNVLYVKLRRAKDRLKKYM